MTQKFRNIFPIVLVCAIVVAASTLMFRAAFEESAIMDEVAHIPAGYGYVKYLDFRLNPEHPPFLKALAAIPLLFADVRFPVDHTSWTKDVNGQWEAGAQFLYKYGNNADQIIHLARIFPILLTVLTIILIYIWSREIIGKWWALLPTVLFGLSPTVLAHGHYVTTDIAATFGIFLATYLFCKFLLHSSPQTLAWAGIGFGIAQLTKFSNALLIPFFVIMTLIYAGVRVLGNKRWWYYIKSLIFIFIIGFAVVYAVYFLFTINYPPARQLSDTSSILAPFKPHFMADIDIFMVKNRLFRPFGEYFLGLLMVLQRSAGGNTGYFLGDISNTGWWYYFPTVLLIKEPLPSIIFLLFGLFFVFKNVIRSWFAIPEGIKSKIKGLTDYLGTHFPEFAMLVFIIIYWAYSMKSPLNIGVRHLIPTLPLIYILTASSLKNWFEKRNSLPAESVLAKILSVLGEFAKRSAKLIFIGALILWLILEVCAASPYFLSYFNEIGGGVSSGYRYVTDSNYDWGQDMKRLQKFVAEPPDGGKINKVAVDYFGGGDARYYLGENVAENWWSARGNPMDKGIEWLAVSVNTLEGAMGTITSDTVHRNAGDGYEWLKELRPTPPGIGQVPRPDMRAGTSIFIYHLK
jgi:hypothetical protein